MNYERETGETGGVAAYDLKMNMHLNLWIPQSERQISDPSFGGVHVHVHVHVQVGELAAGVLSRAFLTGWGRWEILSGWQ